MNHKPSSFGNTRTPKVIEFPGGFMVMGSLPGSKVRVLPPRRVDPIKNLFEIEDPKLEFTKKSELKAYLAANKIHLKARASGRDEALCEECASILSNIELLGAMDELPIPAARRLISRTQRLASEITNVEARLIFLTASCKFAALYLDCDHLMREAFENSRRVAISSEGEFDESLSALLMLLVGHNDSCKAEAKITYSRALDFICSRGDDISPHVAVQYCMSLVSCQQELEPDRSLAYPALDAAKKYCQKISCHKGGSHEAQYEYLVQIAIYELKAGHERTRIASTLRAAHESALEFNSFNKQKKALDFLRQFNSVVHNPFISDEQLASVAKKLIQG